MHEINRKIDKMVTTKDQENLKSKIDSNIISYRYETGINDLILDSLARFMSSSCGGDRNNPLGFMFHREKLKKNDPNEKTIISKVIVSANKMNNEIKTATKDLFHKISESHDIQLFINETLKNCYLPINKENISVKKRHKRKSQKKVDFVRICDKLILKNEARDEIRFKKGFKVCKIKENCMETILNNIKFVIENLDIFQETHLISVLDEFLLMLNLILDIYLIFEMKQFYDFKFTDELFDFISIENQQENQEIEKEIIKRDFHCEAQIALYYSRYYEENSDSKYIGVTKLCCPLCAKFLESLGYRFRGSHSSAFLGMRAWSLKEFNIDSNQFRNEVDLTSFEHSLNELDQILNSKDYGKIQIFFKSCMQIDSDLFDYGKQFRNSSFDFDIIHRQLNQCKCLSGNFKTVFHKIYELYTGLIKICIKEFLQKCDVIYFKFYFQKFKFLSVHNLNNILFY